MSDVVFDVITDDGPNHIFHACEKSQNICPSRVLGDIGEKTFQFTPYTSNVVRVNTHDSRNLSVLVYCGVWPGLHGQWQ